MKPKFRKIIGKSYSQRPFLEEETFSIQESAVSVNRPRPVLSYSVSQVFPRMTSMLPELRTQRSIQCRKTNWSKLSLGQRFTFNVEVLSFHFFIQGCQVCPSFAKQERDF